MSTAWCRTKYHDFVRDVLRDFCLAGLELEKQFEAYDRDGRVNFEAVRALLGGGMNKGLLWRLKDSAHHLFRSGPEELPLGRLLDYSIGFIFHETLKLKESAYQQLRYSPCLDEMRDDRLPGQEKVLCAGLGEVLRRSNGEISGLVSNLRDLLDSCCDMFPHYLSHHRDNPLLARLLFEAEDVVRAMFRSRFDLLLDAVYGDAPEQRFILASRSLREGGWKAKAHHALDAAEAIRPDSLDLAAERAHINAL